MSQNIPTIRHPPNTVAVIGLGVAGLGATKNLVEQGFDVVAFERNGAIGGLWTYNTDPHQTTVLKITRANGSKQSSCYHDFPFPDDVPDYATAQQVADYMHAYAKHFNLEKHFRLNTTLEYISPSTSPSPSASSSTIEPIESSVHNATTGTSTKWDVRVKDESGVRVETFDKVLVTTGPFGKAYLPDTPGQEDFKGEIIHAQSYKGPEGFEGKRVVVVGMSNTGCDVAVDLCNHGAEVSISHRSGVRLMQRTDPPIDHQISRRRFQMGSWLNSRFPTLASWLVDRALQWKFRRENPDYKEEWGFFPPPPIASSPGVVNDDILRLMSEDKIKNLFGLVRFTSNGIVTRIAPLNDKGKAVNGTIGEVETPADIVIFSTACDFDYSFLSPEADPTHYPQPEWDAVKSRTNNLQFPRLYQTLFHLDHPTSLAFIGPCRGFSIAAFSNSDLAAQAITQVWKGNFPLPPRVEMEKWVERDYQRALSQARVWRIGKIGTEPMAFERWLDEAAGTGVNEHLGWGWEGWKFWWNERRLYGLVMDGVNSPHTYRLFDGMNGAREKWDGAREAIFKANGKSY